jgi:drug/metabolite transporter (DMT)-like permease
MATASLVDTHHASRRLSKKTWILTLVIVFTQAFGNLFLSWGMKHQTADLGVSPVGYIRAIFSPSVAFGIALLIVWLLTRMTLLSWADLSFVLPVTAIGYVLSAISGKYVFEERISWQRWLGTLLIVGGVALVGMTRPNTTAGAH